MALGILKKDNSKNGKKHELIEKLHMIFNVLGYISPQKDILKFNSFQENVSLF